MARTAFWNPPVKPVRTTHRFRKNSNPLFHLRSRRWPNGKLYGCFGAKTWVSISSSTAVMPLRSTPFATRFLSAMVSNHCPPRPRPHRWSVCARSLPCEPVLVGGIWSMKCKNCGLTSAMRSDKFWTTLSPLRFRDR